MNDMLRWWLDMLTNEERDLAMMRHREMCDSRARAISETATEYIMFVSSGGRLVPPMPEPREAGY